MYVIIFIMHAHPTQHRAHVRGNAPPCTFAACTNAQPMSSPQGPAPKSPRRLSHDGRRPNKRQTDRPRTPRHRSSPRRLSAASDAPWLHQGAVGARSLRGWTRRRPLRGRRAGLSMHLPPPTGHPQPPATPTRPRTRSTARCTGARRGTSSRQHSRPRPGWTQRPRATKALPVRLQVP